MWAGHEDLSEFPRFLRCAAKLEIHSLITKCSFYFLTSLCENPDKCLLCLCPSSPIIKCHDTKKRTNVIMCKECLAGMFTFHNVPLCYNLSMEKPSNFLWAFGKIRDSLEMRTQCSFLPSPLLPQSTGQSTEPHKLSHHQLSQFPQVHHPLCLHIIIFITMEAIGKVASPNPQDQCTIPSTLWHASVDKFFGA